MAQEGEDVFKPAEELVKKECPPMQRYKMLGRSGLRVSPLCLGTMAFGTKWTEMMGKVEKDEVFKMLDMFVEAGGNFIDTADKYQEGQTEEWLGEYLASKGENFREELVIATKYSLPMVQYKNKVNATGNHKKNMFASLRDSLKRLRCEYVDIFYVHYWDFTTGLYEIMRALDDLVRSGKVLHLGASDWPAWIVAKANTLAEAKGWTPFTVYQGKFNIGEREMERDIIPMSVAEHMGVVPFSVMGAGKYTGKYKRGEAGAVRGGFFTMQDRDYDIAEEVAKIAEECKAEPAQIVVKWATLQRGITSPLVGCRTLKHLSSSLAALDVVLTEDQLARLAKVAKFDIGFPHDWTQTTWDYHKCRWLDGGGYIE